MPDRPRPAELAARIDHAVLKPHAPAEAVREACSLAAQLQLGCLCLRPTDVARAAGWLEGTGVTLGSVAGFPHGSAAPTSKAADAAWAVGHGASEIDMVCHIAGLIDGQFDAVVADIAAVVAAASGATVKVILECCYLTDAQIVAGCRAARQAGAHFVKTSTGFGEHGATVEHVRLLRQTVGPEFGVKAAGGIRSLDDALAMLSAGADRLGTSSARAILAELSA
jgi:deoxyribose-phosphate aldolase